MDLQLAHDIISICNEDSGGATVEDCAEQLGITGARLADVFDTFEEFLWLSTRKRRVSPK